MDGNAVVYCEGAFRTLTGKTAHGLVRYTNRYRVRCVIDSTCSGIDAGYVLDGFNKKPLNIPILDSLDAAFELFGHNLWFEYFVVGLAPDGGRFTVRDWEVIKHAVENGMHVDSGLHDFVSDNPEIAALAKSKGVTIRDIRKPPPRDKLHFFTGKIEDVTSPVIAVLGTDSAVGKRTTAQKLVAGINAFGKKAELIGTGQTSWLQGARYCIPLDSLVNDFVTGEIEHAVWSCWNELHPDVIVVEGQGSLLNPGYPGGYEILAAARPDQIILQHAPNRKYYDGFSGYKIQELSTQISALQIISDGFVTAIALNHEGYADEEIPAVCRALESAVGIPVYDVLFEGPEHLVNRVLSVAGYPCSNSG